MGSLPGMSPQMLFWLSLGVIIPCCSAWTIDALALNMIPYRNGLERYRLGLETAPDTNLKNQDTEEDQADTVVETPPTKSTSRFYYKYPGWYNPLNRFTKRSAGTDSGGYWMNDDFSKKRNKISVPWSMQLFSPMLRGK